MRLVESSLSVSPQKMLVNSGEVGDEGEEGERLRLEAEDKFVRKLVDPKLPSKDEVDKHYLMGHIPYRNWCPICVKSFGKEMDHKQDDKKNS